MSVEVTRTIVHEVNCRMQCGPNCHFVAPGAVNSRTSTDGVNKIKELVRSVRRQTDCNSGAGEKAQMSNYNFSVALVSDFGHATDVLVSRLQKAGFQVVSDLNIRTMLNEKLGVDV